MRFLSWLFHTDPGFGEIAGWNQVRADKHALETERLLLGAAGPARVVGNRRREAFWQAVDAKQSRPKVRRFEQRRG